MSIEDQIMRVYTVGFLIIDPILVLYMLANLRNPIDLFGVFLGVMVWLIVFRLYYKAFCESHVD